MKLRKTTRREDKGAPKWMVTFSDMMTLILVFFILLFSMSQIDRVKFKAVAESFNNRAMFDFNPSIVEFENPSSNKENENQEIKKDGASTEESGRENNKDTNEEPNSLNDLVKEVETFLKENQLNKVISANRTDRGVVLTLQEQVLFESARADIIDDGKPFLEKVSKLLTNIPNHVKVEGHTDDRPISTFRYPSNWELSTARASSVIRYLTRVEQLDTNRFSAVGYGATRPVAPNNSPDNWEKNRRVEIVILDPNYDESQNDTPAQ
ncbi:flagellar motor protein MotB [Pontibacillus yanchengensis]|uniref:Flagellar motor protein MotB n=1 Tax=Pontibacillus yanchengensis TaxID=462910 RepID=A0ACC7VEG9_9BACI|nr:flagellar motor protein MotS [Pontibacillus yanchengensis]MYL53178.1 flagellar motor protein MotB [Pontibacillus yanchengensis]